LESCQRWASGPEDRPGEAKARFLTHMAPVSRKPRGDRCAASHAKCLPAAPPMGGGFPQAGSGRRPRHQDVRPQAARPARLLPGAAAPPSDCSDPPQRSAPLRRLQSRRPHAQESLRTPPRSPPSRSVGACTRRCCCVSPPPASGACARPGSGSRQKGQGKNSLLQARPARGVGPGSADWGAWC